MLHADPDVWRITTRMFAEFQKKISRDFRTFLKRFAPAQAKLVELKAEPMSTPKKVQ
jgi:hypothetical protein